MFSALLLAFLMGIAVTFVFQEIVTSIRGYRDRKQAEFDAAVEAAARKRDQLRQLHANDPFAELETEWNNVRKVTDPYSFD